MIGNSTTASKKDHEKWRQVSAAAKPLFSRWFFSAQDGARQKLIYNVLICSEPLLK
jgi:hypothetical protein